MFRKPKPKDAARTIIEMYAAKGIEVPMSLALETVAKVEGFNDWGTMARTVPDAKEKTTKKTAQKTATAFPAFPRVSNDDGPFAVLINGEYYDTVERFSRACSVAEVMAADESASYGRLVSITDRAGKTVASYISTECRYRVFSCSGIDDPSALGNLELYIEENWDSEWTPPTRDEVIKLCKQLAHEALKDEEDVIVGVQEYVCDENGRVHNATPPVVPCFIVRSWNNELTVTQEAPGDIRKALLAAYVK